MSSHQKYSEIKKTKAVPEGKIQNNVIHLVPYNSHSFINKQYKLKSCTAVVAMIHYASVTYTIDT